MFKKISITVLGIAILAIPNLSSAQTNQTFSDITSSTPYSKAINWMSQNSIVEGYSDQTFRPDSCVNRVEFLKMLMWTLNVNVSQYNSTITFPDTPNNSWYASYVQAGKALGIIQGYPDGTFHPAQCVNRAEAIKMASLQFFPDTIWSNYYLAQPPYADIEHNPNVWYVNYIDFSITQNLIGTEHVANMHYNPGESMTRGEVAEMLYRMKASQDNNNKIFNDSLVPETNTSQTSQPTSQPTPQPTPQSSACYGEGQNLGALVPSNFNNKCCSGLVPYVPTGITGTMGTCQKPGYIPPQSVVLLTSPKDKAFEFYAAPCNWGNIQFTWEAASGAVSYTLYLKNNDSKTNAPITKTYNTSNTSYNWSIKDNIWGGTNPTTWWVRANMADNSYTDSLTRTFELEQLTCTSN